MNTIFSRNLLQTFCDAPGKHLGADCVQLAMLDSPLGPMVAGASAEGVCLLEFVDRTRIETQLASLRKVFDMPLVAGSNAYLERLKVELAGYFAGTLREFSVPLAYPGSDFQRRVWAQLTEIRYGQTRSYEALAAAVGDKKAVRAVGRANGLNRIAIVIPCHRVINKSGALGGYAGGLPRKQFLLELERAQS